MILSPARMAFNDERVLIPEHVPYSALAVLGLGALHARIVRSPR